MRDGTVRRLSTLHRQLYRLTAGRIGRRLVDNDILLLTTVGLRTGRDHTVPLLYLREGDAFIVIASFGGRPDHPQWYKNLVAHPGATVQVGEKTVGVRARTATTEQRSRLWPQAERAYYGYAFYQTRTGREIPVVILEPQQ